MKLIDKAAEWIARRFNVPQLAITMFKKANELSGLGKETIPTELIPLNMIQLSRGLLNFTLLQSIRSWVFPYWGEQQYAPHSPSFVPRSHLGLSMNLTHRNWTAVGSMECDIEPIVDPRGLVTPFRDGWSLDVWFFVNGKLFLPSKASGVHQRLVENLPIVETSFSVGNLAVTLTTFVVKAELVHRATLRNLSSLAEQCKLYVALRPFNPDGVSLVHDIEYLKQERSLVVNKRTKLRFDFEPTLIHCSTFERGDCGNILDGEKQKPDWVSAHCDIGLANAVVGLHVSLAPQGEQAFETKCSLLERTDDGQDPATVVNPSDRDPIRTWNEIVATGATVTTPDDQINSLFNASLATLLLLVDHESITPGPSTYHHFWFRDAAYMLYALDVAGFSHYTKPVIKAFPQRQVRSGYFRSQQGEWDSNGQAVWTTLQHALLSNDVTLLRDLFTSLYSGVKWINEKRLTSTECAQRPFAGLMPRGLSAEHLGLADYYFWDNFWSLAGLEAFTAVCERLERHVEKDHTLHLTDKYRHDVDEALRLAHANTATIAIPAGPLRGIDCGMIGSIAAWYPLQLFPPNDPRLAATLRLLEQRFFVDGMFFQDFIHSGMNAYLTLQIAHCWLYAGNRELFWKMFSTVCSFASPTMNFPEAIHPATRGGCMGDGHHGWAAAEIVLAVRDAVVFERRRNDSSEVDLMLLSGIPVEWFAVGKQLRIERMPFVGGVITMRIQGHRSVVNVEIQIQPSGVRLVKSLVLTVPIVVQHAIAEQGEILPHLVKENESQVELPLHSIRLRLFR